MNTHIALPAPRRIAVVGSGIAGLSAAWLLSQWHDVTLFEQEPRLGGHSHTIDVAVQGQRFAVDTGFIVFNEPAYPNLVALFAHLGVETHETDMSFGVSLDEGRLEYSGGSWGGLFAQRANLLRPRFWSMLKDTLRFYREAPAAVLASPGLSIDEFLDRHGYGAAFREDHLYPMAAAIWSTPSRDVGAQSALGFIRFCDNHGLLTLRDRPVWRSVSGGSRNYVAALRSASRAAVRTGSPVVQVSRGAGGVTVRTADGAADVFDHVVIGAHADQTLRMLAEPTPEERRILGVFRYAHNDTWLHTDAALMPRRRAVWSSWNYLASRQGTGAPDRLTATYWMNRLQPLPVETPVLVTLNPSRPPDPATVLGRFAYEHPQFDLAVAEAQRALWSLQGRDRIWYCGAYFGAGFHEDGLQSGLAVAEALGGVQRPWVVENPNGRIVVTAPAVALAS